MQWSVHIEDGKKSYGFDNSKRSLTMQAMWTTLVVMLAKYDEIRKDKRVFNMLHEKQVASWNAMINGLAVDGGGKEALGMFLEMLQHEVPPNDQS